MMIYVCMRYFVQDYPRWKETFDIHLAERQAGGATDEICVLRNVDDRNDLTVILGWRDLRTAHLFAQSVSLQMLMQKLNVTESTITIVVAVL